ncbi:MAG TPA: GGDEF domain-containing protein [Polyangiales bacterium]|nr:GGDEF domain-containing protein [Polyangiales bacterium]
MTTSSKTTELTMKLDPEAETTRMRRSMRVTAGKPTLPIATMQEPAQTAKPAASPFAEEQVALRTELACLQIFEGLSAEMLDALVLFCPVLELEAGQALLRAGDANDRMFVVLSGELRVHLGNENATAVAALRAGDTVGELSVIDLRPVSATVVAHSSSKLLAVSEQMFWRVCHASHGFAVRLMLKLADRLRANNTTVAANLELCAKLEAVAARDALTNVQSRRWLDETLPQLCAQHQKSGEGLSVAVIDVDHFKRVNDSYGHATGDVVLVEVAKTLRAKLRPTDFVARMGGEEFVVILPHTRGAGARVACERLGQAVRMTAITTREGHGLPNVTVSIGVAELLPGDDAASMVERADAALYRAKNNGRDRVEL